MKIQDIGFLFVLLVLFVLKKPRLSVIAGLVCLVLAIPLFSFWVFFTAKRLTWYAAAFFFLVILQNVIANSSSRQNADCH